MGAIFLLALPGFTYGSRLDLLRVKKIPLLRFRPNWSKVAGDNSYSYILIEIQTCEHGPLV